MSARKNNAVMTTRGYPKNEEEWADCLETQKKARDFLTNEKTKASKLINVVETEIEDDLNEPWYGKNVDGSSALVKGFFKHDSFDEQAGIFAQIRACDYIEQKKHNQSFSFTVKLDIHGTEKRKILNKERQYECISSSESECGDASKEARVFEVKKPVSTVIADGSGEDGLFFRFLNDASIGRFQKTDGIEHHVPWNSHERDVERKKFFNFTSDIMRVSEMETRQASSSSSLRPLGTSFDNEALITVVKLLAESITNLLMETKQRYSMVEISLEFALFTDDSYLKKRKSDQKQYVWKLEEMEHENNQCLHQLEAGVCKNTGHLVSGAGDFSSCYKYHLDYETNKMVVEKSNDVNVWAGSTHVAKMCRMTRTLIGQRVLQRKSRFEGFIPVYEEYLDNLDTMLKGELGIKLNDRLEPIRVTSKRRDDVWPELLPLSKYERIDLSDSSDE